MKKIVFPGLSGFLIAAALSLVTFSACNSDDYSQPEHEEPTHVDHAPSDSELSRSVDTMMIDKTRVTLDSADRTIPLHSDSITRAAKDSAHKAHPGKSDKH